jgi:opacity protein-like surface antigen
LRVAVALFLPAGPLAAQNYIDIDLGAVYSDVDASEVTIADGVLDGTDTGVHLGLGAYRNSENSDWIWGVKLELDDIGGNRLLSVRALDLGFKVTERISVNGFVGGARWDLATAAYGWRFGLGASFRLNDRWALGADLTYSDSIARDKLLPDEQETSENPEVPDIFYNINQMNVYLKYIF